MDGLIKTFEDKDKVKSILKMSSVSLELISELDQRRYSTHIIKEYYEIIRNLSNIILLLDGFKTVGERAHINLIKYLLNEDYVSLEEYMFIDELRTLRNKILYDGDFVDYVFVKKKKDFINKLIEKLKDKVNSKL